MASNSEYPRDVVGYGQKPPHARWPNNARVALSFVINYEEGGEGCVLHGDPASEHLLSEIVGAAPLKGVRHMNMETLYEYGSRAGFWRLHRIFTGRKMPATVFAVGMALERNPEAGRAMVDAGWEVASHGYRWIDYQDVPEEVEREHIRKTVEVHRKVLGQRPVGIYQGKPNERTRRLIVEEGGFMYDCDSYSDDLPYWEKHNGRDHLVVPYTLDNNDMRWSQGNEGDHFYQYLKDAFDQLYEEGLEAPKMMTVGLHCRIVGRPGRARALCRFLDYVREKTGVWICTRADIARHWYKEHPPNGRKGAKM